MTREERELAITYLEEMKETYIEGVGYERHPLPEYYAIESAIKALEQEPKIEKVIKMRDATPEERESIDKYVKSISKPTGVDFWDLEQEPCEDAISRQTVLDMLEDINAETEGVGFYYEHYVEYIKKLPPVKPQQKTGHWRHYESMLICSECGTEFYDDIMEYCGDDVPKCCPNCGARMERGDKK